ncbi:MAG: hypothetical protein KatS3mg126_1498 [Lysobacteraceae bacterium]|nr:MAG: hypothetical protein KatS3mg126_1498 [Xanthomonadaceae bacterium]
MTKSSQIWSGLLQKGCPRPGLVRRIDGPRTDVDDWTTIEYYTESDAGCGTGGECRFRAGDVRRIVNALGHETVYLAYDGAGRWLRSRDANGVITDRTYHARGWLASFTVRANADGSPSTEDATTRIEYSPTGKVVAVTDPDGVRMRYAYDEADRLVRICDATGNARCTRGNRIEYTLDAAGNRVVERVFDRTNTLRRRLARQFDALGRLDRARDALDASGQPLAGEALGDPQQGRVTADFEYDANGNRIGEVDGRGVRGRQVYDPLNRLIATIQDYGGTDPDTADATTRFGYDALDHLRTVTDPNGLVTRYEYDGLGNQTALISPDTGVTRLTHDAAGNVLAPDRCARDHGAAGVRRPQPSACGALSGSWARPALRVRHRGGGLSVAWGLCQGPADGLCR